MGGKELPSAQGVVESPCDRRKPRTETAEAREGLQWGEEADRTTD
jgi:hypothetical protein